jgi:hypothetical protein
VLRVPDYTLVFIAAAVIVLILIAIIFYLYKKKQRAHPLVLTDKDIPGHPIGSLDYKPRLPTLREIRQFSPLKAEGSPADLTPQVFDQPTVKDFKLTEGRSDITSSLLALSGKYSLDQITLSTKDGLVFASSGSKTAQNDAAIFGGMNADGSGNSVPGVLLFTLVHQSSDLTGIVRTKNPVSETVLRQIEADTKDILNFWI